MSARYTSHNNTSHASRKISAPREVASSFDNEVEYAS